MLRSSVFCTISKEKVESSKRFTKKRKQKYTYSVLSSNATPHVETAREGPLDPWGYP